jgi:cytochrome P450
MCALHTGTADIAYRDAQVHLPPGPPLPRSLQGAAFVAARRQTMQVLSRRYGSAFTLSLPVFGHTVVVSDPQLAKQVFTTPAGVLSNVQPNLGRILGDRSMFSLEGDDHRRRRKLLTPPLHGKSVKGYEQIIEEEVLREIATWPENNEFESLAPMMHITLGAILRAVFGADGEQLDSLRRLIPPMVELGSRLATLPNPRIKLGNFNPWERFTARRREYDGIIENLIETVRNDPDFAERTDIVSLMLRSTYDDGSPMSTKEIADELLTLLAAGHETTATTLAWAFERLRRNPDVLSHLVSEVDNGGKDFRQATILEVQRSRPVIDLAGRTVVAPILELGEWRIPQGHTILVGISLLHDDSHQFGDPERFDPSRFLDNKPSAAWLPFGGGTRRCIGAAFANMEMDVALRTILANFDLLPTTAPAERWHSRGVAYAPRRKGRIAVRRR